MNGLKIKHPIWYLLVPFLIHGLVEYIVQFFYSAYLLMGIGMPENLVYGSDEMYQVIQKLGEKIMEHGTQISSITAVFLIPFYLFLFRRDWKKRKNVGMEELKSVAALKFLLLIPLGIVASIVSSNIINMSELALYSEKYQNVSKSLYSASLPVMAVGLGVVVPISEELMFRGLLYNRLKDMTSQKKAWFFSSFFFGLYHGNPVQAIYGCLAGILLVYIYEKYRTIAAPILTHMILNLTSAIVTKMGGFTWMFEDMKRVCIITIVGGMLLGFCLMYVYEMDRERNSLPETGRE